MSEATDVASVLAEVFPRDDAVAAMHHDEFRGRLARLEQIAWPDFDVVMVGASPSVRLEFKGIDGLLAAWRDWLSPFDTHRTDIEGFEDVGDRAVILIRQFARPHGADAEVENPGAAVLWTRDGRLSRIEFHISREEALRAAGL